LGKYEIKVIGTLPDQTFTSFIFTIEIIRRNLSKVYLKVDLIANIPSIFSLPFIQDTKNEYVTHSKTLPSFTSFSFPDYTFSP
jgi:hypothetical protein